jgi:hypothetical protein
MDNLMAFLGTIVFGIAIALCCTTLVSYVMLDVSILYDIPKLKELTYWQMFGLLLLSRIVLFKTKDEDDKNNTDNPIVNIVVKAIEYVILILSFWGIAHVVHQMFVL